MESLSRIVEPRDVPCNIGMIELTSKLSVSLRDFYQKKLFQSSVKSIIGFCSKLSDSLCPILVSSNIYRETN